MNDHEHFSALPDASANEGRTSPTGTASVASRTLGDIKARRSEIAAAILKPDPSARVSVAALVALFRDDIAKALVQGRSWAEIAAALSTSGITARPDAVRMAHRRLSQRQSQQSPRPLVLPVATEPSHSLRHPDMMRSANLSSDRPPSIAKRIR